MSTAAAPAAPPAPGGFRHEAVFYGGADDFVDRCTDFVRDGVAAGDSTLVVVSAEKVSRLRDALGEHADGVAFADMGALGANPARIIPAWRRFLTAHGGNGARLRGIGEPISAERGTDELVECQLHEALLNLAFADAADFWLVCPYDVESLPSEVLDEARRSHPHVHEGGRRGASETYPGHAAFASRLAEALPDPPADAEKLSVRADSLALLRRRVFRRADAAGLDAAGAGELILAVHELAANSVRYGGGTATVLAWDEADALVWEVRDAGHVRDPLLGREEAGNMGEGGRGLWLVNQLCDLVQVRSRPGSTVVRVRKRR